MLILRTNSYLSVIYHSIVPPVPHLTITTVAISILLTKVQCHHAHSFRWETEAQKGLDNLFKTTHAGLWHFWTVVLEKTLESPLDCKEIKPVNPKRKQSCIFIGRTDAEALILWPPDVKSRFIGKDPDAGKDWRQEKRGMTEDEIVEWHHWFNGHELGKTLGDGEGQGSLVYCSPWGLKKSEMTWLLNNNNSKDSGNKDVIFSEKI